jgi:hypothetical protein
VHPWWMKRVVVVGEVDERVRVLGVTYVRRRVLYPAGRYQIATPAPAGDFDLQVARVRGWRRDRVRARWGWESGADGWEKACARNGCTSRGSRNLRRAGAGRQRRGSYSVCLLLGCSRSAPHEATRSKNGCRVWAYVCCQDRYLIVDRITLSSIWYSIEQWCGHIHAARPAFAWRSCTRGAPSSPVTMSCLWCHLVIYDDKRTRKCGSVIVMVDYEGDLTAPELMRRRSQCPRNPRPCAVRRSPFVIAISLRRADTTGPRRLAATPAPAMHKTHAEQDISLGPRRCRNG